MTTTHPLAPYPSPQARERELDEIASVLGAELTEYGRTVRGLPLRAIRIPSRSAAAQPPTVLCTANIHGPEYIGGRVAFGLLRALSNETPQSMALIDRAEVWVIPCLNPDGYAATWRAQGQARLAALRPNANGVDLNRNFPLPSGAPSWLPGAGSDQPGDATYRGEHALSEPETAALDKLLAQHRFHASANLHSFMGTVIPARVTDKPAFKAYKHLAAAFASAQRRRYRRLSSRVFDVFTGEQEDHQHHVHRTWACCIESFPVLASLRQRWSASSTFWRFNPKDPAAWVANDVPALLAYFHAALELERPSSPP